VRIDINCDMGESFGNYRYGADEEIIGLITSANIACGFHAGDPLVMDRTVALAAQHGVSIGAHPSFPDLMGFGRREMAATPQEVRDYVTYQVGALAGFARAHGVTLRHVKGHGAIYNMAAVDLRLAKAMVEGVARVDPQLIFVGLAGSCLLQAAKQAGLAAASEVFADRAYNPDGTLVSRRLPGAVIHDPKVVAARVLQMVQHGTVATADGQLMRVAADTVCIHGDTQGAAGLAQAIRQHLASVGVAVLAMDAAALSG
jgi:UPF0271 protein